MSELPNAIASELKAIHKRIDQCATKDDLKGLESRIGEKFATKDDLKAFATKGDLKNFATKEDLKNFATKDDLKKFATKDDLKNFATKDDLKNCATKDDIRLIIDHFDAFFVRGTRLDAIETTVANHETRIFALEEKGKRYEQE